VQPFEVLSGPNGAVDALVRLQQEGVVEHLGFAGSGLRLTDRFLATGVFSVVITHNQLTLINNDAAPYVERWTRDVAVINAAPYAGGILARGPAHGRYLYRAHIPKGVMQRFAEIEQICAHHGVPIAAAALQFSLRNPFITSTIVGMSSPERIEETLALASAPLPDALWSALDRPGRARVGAMRT
jgi:D-threo-aldose 1-dehydrogenase